MFTIRTRKLGAKIATYTIIADQSVVVSRGKTLEHGINYFLVIVSHF